MSRKTVFAMTLARENDLTLTQVKRILKKYPLKSQKEVFLHGRPRKTYGADEARELFEQIRNAEMELEQLIQDGWCYLPDMAEKHKINYAALRQALIKTPGLVRRVSPYYWRAPKTLLCREEDVIRIKETITTKPRTPERAEELQAEKEILQVEQRREELGVHQCWFQLGGKRLCDKPIAVGSQFGLCEQHERRARKKLNMQRRKRWRDTPNRAYQPDTPLEGVEHAEIMA